MEIKAADEATNAVEKALKEEYGDKYDTFIEDASNVATKLGITETLDKHGLGSNPEILKMLNDMNSKLSEASLKTPGSPTADFGTIDEKLKAITESDAYTDSMHVDHKTKMVERDELLAQKHNVQVAG